jgi:hypothetical protein
MHSQRLVKRALRLGLLVTLVVFALSTCEEEKKQRGSSTRPLPEYEKALRSGEYHSEDFKPSLTFKVDKGWSTSPPEVFDALFLTRGETVGLGFVSAQQVYATTKSGTPIVVNAPEDLIGWFQKHPYLQTSKPQPVTVGGVKGVQFDVVVEDLPEDYSGVCGGDCVDIFRSSAIGSIAFMEDNKQRVIVLGDVKGVTVTMGFSIRATDFDEFAPEAQEVILSVQWRDS